MSEKSQKFIRPPLYSAHKSMLHRININILGQNFCSKIKNKKLFRLILALKTRKCSESGIWVHFFRGVCRFSLTETPLVKKIRVGQVPWGRGVQYTPLYQPNHTAYARYKKLPYFNTSLVLTKSPWLKITESVDKTTHSRNFEVNCIE